MRHILHLICIASIISGCWVAKRRGSAALREEPPRVLVSFDSDRPDRGLTILAENARLEDLVRAVFGKMAELEGKSASFDFGPGVADRPVSMRLVNEKRRSKLFSALAEAGACKMVVSREGSHASFVDE